MRNLLLILLAGISGLFFSPIFAYAGGDCYVDADASSGGDGSKSKPYSSISKALDEGCDDIDVKKGTYKDNITIGGGVKLEGDSESGVIITGKVTMKDNSEIKKVTIKGGGVYVSNNAGATIIGVTIKDSSPGIETSGSGKLTVKDSKIFGNRKGFYLQAGKNVSITSSDVSNNTEEGIDIRSNVDGIISGNIIEDNGEGGIEVVLGKSDLIISNNKIKDNHSSGIATQFYDSSDEFGGVKINNNTISGNSDYAVNCKLPSGGSLPAEYWSKSTSLIGNTISGNKDGDFAPRCNFSASEITNATKTEEELEAEKKAEEEAIAKYKAPPGETMGRIKVLQTPSNSLNLREGPAISYNIVNTVKTGDEYEYSETENGWYKIRVSDSLWGWVSGSYVEKVTEEDVQQEEEEEEEEEYEEAIILESKKDEVMQTDIQEQDKEEVRDSNDNIIFGTIFAVLILFLIFLFSPLADKVFPNKKEPIVLEKGSGNVDDNNF